MWKVKDAISNNQNGTELFHYGVKGMKWGVRKEYEKAGNVKGKSASKNSKLVDLNDKDTWGKNPGEPDSKPSDYVIAIGVNSNFLSKINESAAFREYAIKEMGVNGVIKLANDYESTTQKYLDALGSRDLDSAKKYEMEAIRIGQKMDKMMTEFGQTHPNDMTEQEIADEEAWAQMVDMLGSDDFKEVLADGSTITMERWWDGKHNVPKYIFRGRDGTVKSFNFGDEDALKAYASEEKKQKVDFRDTAKGKRTREKNVDPNAKPVNIKKGEKIEISEKERRSKARQSPASAKTQQELLSMAKLKGEYGENAIKRNKIMRDANLRRNNKKLETVTTPIKPNVKVSTLSKLGNTIKSGVNSVKKYIDQTSASLAKKSDGRNFIEKLFDIREGKKKAASYTVKESMR